MDRGGLGLGADGVPFYRGEHGLVYCGLNEAGDERQHFRSEEVQRVGSKDSWKPGRGT